VGKRSDIYGILVEKPEGEKSHLEDQDSDGRIIIKVL
jgi:hypothetical protein